MAYPQPLGYTGANVTGGQTSAQEDWPVEFSELAPAFDLLDILNSNGDFGQQNQNVELALHGLDKSDQFRTAFPPSHNRVTTSTSWPSVQAAPSFHAEQTQILDRQAYHPSHHVQTGQILGSGDASAFPFSVPDVFQGSQYLRASNHLSQTDPSMGSVQKPSPTILVSNRAEWITPTSSSQLYCENPLSLLPNPRKRAQCEEVETRVDSNTTCSVNETAGIVIEASVRANAICFIKFWLVKYPGIFPKAKQINALAELCKLPPTFVEMLLNQIIREQPLGKVEVDEPVQKEHPAKRVKTRSRARLQKQLSDHIPDGINLEEVASWVKERAPRCRPVPEPGLLHRDETRIYQCTLQCGKGFDRKDDWRRHEEQNYPREGWICDLDATAVVKGILTCSYCEIQDPDAGHATQNHPKRFASKHCKDKPLDARGRISYRKYRFLGHLKKIHQSIPSAEYVTRSHFLVDSRFPRRCGFCHEYEFRNWQDRIEHISHHFESGQDVSSWKPTDPDQSHDKDESGDRNPPQGNDEDRKDALDEGSASSENLPDSHRSWQDSGSSSSSGGLQDEGDDIKHNTSSSLKSWNNGEFLEASDRDDAPAGHTMEADSLSSLDNVTEMPGNLSSIAISPSNQPDNTVKDIIDGSASAPGPDDHDSTNNILEAKREESSSRLVGLGRILRPHKMRKTTLNADDITQMDVTYPDLGICHRIPSPPAESSCYMSDTTGFAISPDSPDPNGDTVFNSMHETSGSVILSPRMNRPKSAKSLVPTKPGSKLWLPDSKWENITVSENKFTSAKSLIGNVPEKRRFGCRNGPMSPELAKHAMRACWPCRMVKVKCDSGTPCHRCIKSSLSPFAHRLCARQPFKDFNEMFFPGVLASYLTQPEIERLVGQYSPGFKDSKIFVEITCGPSFPPMTLEVKMFEPNTDDLLNTNYADANLQEKDGHTHQDSAVPICILGTYVPDLKTKCMTLIQSMISEAGYTMGVSPKNSSKLSKDILEAVHKFSLLKPNWLSCKAIMLHAMYYVMKQSITVNHATVEEPPKDSDFTPGPLISAKSLSRQVKHTMLLYIRETTKEVLDGLEREILSRTKHSWIVSFGVISIICLCIDEIPATISSVNETFPLRDDLEQEQATVLNIHADLENHPFGVITTIFRNTYHTRLNPLSDDFIPDTNSDWGEHETTFLTEIRQIIADHIGQLDPTNERENTAGPQKNLSKNPGQLLSNFLTSLVSNDRGSAFV